MMRYSFDPEKVLGLKNGAKADPQRLGEELDKIASANKGRLQPQNVVTFAKNRRSALHKHFEWDDTIAADQYRLGQARSIIRAIRVDMKTAEGGIDLARAFLSVADEDGVAYRRSEDVMNSLDLQVVVLKAAQRDLAAFQQRYADLCRFIPEIAEAQRALEERLHARDAAE